MNRSEETKLHASLTEAIENWWDGPAQEAGGLPYVGDSIAELLADAALTVLKGMADVYDALRRNGELKEG